MFKQTIGGKYGRKNNQVFKMDGRTSYEKNVLRRNTDICNN
jgi:hypothetical protein